MTEPTHPVDEAPMEEIEAAWKYFTNLPKGHPNRIYIIAQFSTPWERGTWYEYYTIHYRFGGKEKKTRLLGFPSVSYNGRHISFPITAKTAVIHKILKETNVNISEVPIPSHLPSRVQTAIRERRREETPREERGREEECVEDSDYDEFEEILKEVNSWKKPEVMRLD